jgi:predicted RNase H-like nuclease
MSVLRYNLVTAQQKYRPREDHLKAFFNKIKKGSQPVDNNQDESTLIATDAHTQVANKSGTVKAKKRKKATNIKRISAGAVAKVRVKSKTKKIIVKKLEDKIKGHSFQ